MTYGKQNIICDLEVLSNRFFNLDPEFQQILKLLEL